MCFFKNWVFAFLDDGTFQGGSQVLQNFGHKVGEESLTDLVFFLGGGQSFSDSSNVWGESEI